MVADTRALLLGTGFIIAAFLRWKSRASRSAGLAFSRKATRLTFARPEPATAIASLVHRLLNPLGSVAFKMGRLRGVRKEHIWIDT